MASQSNHASCHCNSYKIRRKFSGDPLKIYICIKNVRFGTLVFLTLFDNNSQ